MKTVLKTNYFNISLNLESIKFQVFQLTELLFH